MDRGASFPFLLFWRRKNCNKIAACFETDSYRWLRFWDRRGNANASNILHFPSHCDFFGFFLLFRWGGKKLLPKISRFLRVAITVFAFILACASIDLALALNHIDPIVAFPVAFAGDGGSAVYVGPFYTVSRKVAYELGKEEPFFDYELKLWFL